MQLSRLNSNSTVENTPVRLQCGLSICLYAGIKNILMRDTIMKLLATAATVAALGFGSAVSAATVSDTKTHTVRGAAMNFAFSGLAASDGSDGTLTLVGDDMDYRTSSTEYFDLEIDGAGFGRFACVGSSATGATIIAGSTAGNSSNCDFSLDITIAGATLAGFLADGALSINLLHGSGVDQLNGAVSTVTATLSYTDATSPVPLPASSLLLVSGLGGLVAMRRRKKA